MPSEPPFRSHCGVVAIRQLGPCYDWLSALRGYGADRFKLLVPRLVAMLGTLSPKSIGASLGRLLLLLTALAGLFAMHGLPGHGMAGPDEMTVAVGHPVVPMAHNGETSASVPTDAGATRTSVQQQTNGDHDLGLLGLCLAVLAAALVLGWPRRRHPGHSPFGWLPPRSLTVALRRARPPQSPDLFALSVQRC